MCVSLFACQCRTYRPSLLCRRYSFKCRLDTGRLLLLSSACTSPTVRVQENVQPLDPSLSLPLHLVLSAIDPHSKPARRFAPVRFHLPVFLLSAAQFSVPGQHQMNLPGQPRFSSRPMAETVSAHDRVPQPHSAFPCSLNPPACPINPARITLVSHLLPRVFLLAFLHSRRHCCALVACAPASCVSPS
jgi:hypothetical protein